MEIRNVDWADSNLESIHIQYDQASLIIWNDTLQHNVCIQCVGLAGITDVCIWDETIISNIEESIVTEANDSLLCTLYQAYDPSFDYGGRSLNDGLRKLKITLANDTCIKVYALSFTASIIH